MGRIEAGGHPLLFNKEIFALSRQQHFKACHSVPRKGFEENDMAQPCLLTVLLSPAETCHFHSQWAALNQTEAIDH